MPNASGSRGSNVAPLTGARSIKGVVHHLENARTVADLAETVAVAKRFVRRRIRPGRRKGRYSQYEMGVLLRVFRGERAMKADNPDPETPLDAAFWARVEDLYAAEVAAWDVELERRLAEEQRNSPMYD